MSETLLKDIVNLEEQLQEIEQRKAEVDPSNTMRIDELTGEYNLISNRLNEKKYIMDHEQAKEVRIQKQTETIDSLLQEIQDANPFGAMFPKEHYVSVFGLTEYEQYQQNMNEFIYGTLNDYGAKLNELHNSEIELKDEKIRLLNQQGMETENQLAESRKELSVKVGGIQILHNSLNEERESNKRLVEMLNATKQQLNETQEQIEKGKAAELENVKLRQQIVELESKLEQAQKPREAQESSQSIKDRVASLKNKTQLQAGLERWNLPPLPTVEPPTVGEQFRQEDTADDSTAPVADPEADAIPAADSEVDFPVVEGSPELAEQADGKTLEERVRALELAVFGKESVA
jgi:hypothetical protein